MNDAALRMLAARDRIEAHATAIDLLLPSEVDIQAGLDNCTSETVLAYTQICLEASKIESSMQRLRRVVKRALNGHREQVASALEPGKRPMP